MKIFTLLSVTFLSSVTFFSATAASANELSLLTSCQALSDDPKQDKATLCNYYLQGYIAGTLANDVTNVLEQAKPIRQPPSFMERVMERAYLTRVGEKKVRVEATPFHHFCISEGELESHIIGRLSKHLSPPIKTIKVLNERFYSALQAEYPCDQADQE